ncbi:MAG: sensor histidine kinase [Flavisolibacter sp.]|nr:sensor histidine kinase [Flavisolibacter sp.]
MKTNLFMRQQLICFCLVLLATTALHAQDATLRNILAAKDDTAKVKRLMTYAEPFKDTDGDKLSKVYREVLKISTKLKDTPRIGEAWFVLAGVETDRANDSAAIAGYQTALRYLESPNRKRDHLEMIAKCYMNINAISERVGNLELSVQSLNKAISLLEGSPYKRLLYNCYLNMGNMLYNLNEYDKALSYFKKAQSSDSEKKDTLLHITAYSGMSACLTGQKKYSEAYPNAMQALKLAKLTNNSYHLCLAHAYLSDLFINWEKGSEAIHHAKELSKAATEAGSVPYQLIGLMCLADGYKLTGGQVMRISYLNKARQLAQEKGTVAQLYHIYEALSDAYALHGDPSRAFDFYKKYIYYRDSISNENTKRSVSEMEVKYRTAQKEKELSQQKLQISQKEVQLQRSRQTTTYSIAATLLALLVAASVYWHYRNRRRLHEQQLQTLQREKELQLLQAAMEGEEKERSRIAKDLHDGVAGMLAAAKMQLSSLSIKNDAIKDTKEFTQAVKLLDDSSQEVRLTSHNLMPEILTQHGLEEALRRFCNNISNEQVLKIQYDAFGVIGRFSMGFELTVYRIVQELLNNIVKHSQATEATVQLNVQDDFLSITIEDNGIGFDKTKPMSSGTGLNSLRHRIQAMNGTLEIDAQPEQGMTAFIGIDISNYKI